MVGQFVQHGGTEAQRHLAASRGPDPRACKGVVNRQIRIEIVVLPLAYQAAASDDVRTAIRPHRTASNSKLRVRALPRTAGIEACVGGLDPSFRSRASGNERCFVRKRTSSFVSPAANHRKPRNTAPNHRLGRVVRVQYRRRFKPAFSRNWRVLCHDAPLSWQALSIACKCRGRLRCWNPVSHVRFRI
jgi:hypothetical protein